MNDTPSEFVRVPRDELARLRDVLQFREMRKTAAIVSEWIAQHADDEAAAVERAAKALWRLDPHGFATWELAWEFDAQPWRDRVRAVIAALKGDAK